MKHNMLGEWEEGGGQVEGGEAMIRHQDVPDEENQCEKRENEGRSQARARKDKRGRERQVNPKGQKWGIR